MKIAVGLSGGVDSSVAALLLKEAGYDIIAIFMQNWHDTSGTLYGNCSWHDDRAIAEMVARKLDIPFHFADLSEIYSQRVVDYMFEEYRLGRTPNPDVLCNREIKFDAFMKYAVELGADMIATGHYCRKDFAGDEHSGMYRLLSGSDTGKDQSYFLCQLSQYQLSKALFPIGGLIKSEVRALAAKANLPTANKKDSQGICFVGKIDLPVFLQQKLAAKKGDVVEIYPEYYESEPLKKYQINGYISGIDSKYLIESAHSYTYTPVSGKIIGKHNGAHFYTIGQRKGLNIGGHQEPLFVIGIDTERNIVYVGEGGNHPGLYRKSLFIEHDAIHWIRPDLALKENEIHDYKVRIRYRQPLQGAKLFMRKEGLYIVFKEPQRGVTSGQFAAWYEEEELLGSGTIS